VLGALAIDLDGMPVDLGGVRLRSLVALLVLHRNRAVTADALADGLWPEEQPPTAIKTIQVYISRLRRQLGHEGSRLESVGAGYRFNVGDDDLDAARFENRVRHASNEIRAGNLADARTLLESALDLWQGEPLSDVAEQPFARMEADRLVELRSFAREELFEARLLAGEAHMVLGDLRKAVAEQPHRERLVGQLMRALYAEGRQTEALAAFHQARHNLADELGVDPGPALQDLEGAILRQELAISAARETLPLEPLRTPNSLTNAEAYESPIRDLGSKPITSPRAVQLVSVVVTLTTIVLIAANLPLGRLTPSSNALITGAPTPSAPSPLPSLAPSPIPLVVAPDPGDGSWKPTAVGPGTYMWQDFRPVTTLTFASANWHAFGDSPDGAQVAYFGPGTVGVDPPVGEISFIRAQLVLDKPCYVNEVTRFLGDHPQDFIAWVAAHPFLTAGEVQPRNVAGYPGLTVDVAVTRVKTAEDCPEPEDSIPSLMKRIPLLPAAGPGFVLFKGDRGRFIAFDIGGGPPVLVMVRAPAAQFEAFSSLAEPVIESLSIAP
jgi:DNA-binding SARP family transcriptional activator